MSTPDARIDIVVLQHPRHSIVLPRCNWLPKHTKCQQNFEFSRLIGISPGGAIARRARATSTSKGDRDVCNFWLRLYAELLATRRWRELHNRWIVSSAASRSKMIQVRWW
jgi:hypothetical protein